MFRKFFSKPKPSTDENKEPAVGPGYLPVLCYAHNEEAPYNKLYDLRDLPDIPTEEKPVMRANVCKNEVGPGYEPVLCYAHNEEAPYNKLYDLRDLPDIPTEEKPVMRANVYKNEDMENLPLQDVPSYRRMEDMDDDEYGYEYVSVHKKKGGNFKDVFMDAQHCMPYQENSYGPMINRFVFTAEGQYSELSVDEICQNFNNASAIVKKDLRKFIATDLLPALRQDYKIMDLFILLSCKNTIIRAMSIHELEDMILEIDQTRLPREELMKLYELGTVQLFSVLTEIRKNSPVFHPLILVGIMFNCFIYLKAIENMHDWKPFIKVVLSNIESKMKMVIERNESDLRVFMETAKCIFYLENTDLDNTLLLGEDEDDFLPEFSKNNSDVYIEGLASLFHTGNLILRQQSKFKTGVKRLVRIASFMNASDDEGLVKWFHLFLGQIVLRILYQDHHNHLKQDVLEKYEDELLSILMSSTFHSDGFDMTRSLLFHQKERVRSRYREIAKRKGFIFSQATTYNHIQNSLYKFGLDLEVDISTAGAQLGDLFERQECTFCYTTASITCFYDDFPEDNEPKYGEMSGNVPHLKILPEHNPCRKVDLENELEVLKQIESEEFHINVARLLVFNESLPNFYIKERLLGDNLQRRLLAARSKKQIIPISDLIKIIIQTVEGVIHVHSNGCLLRDITTASFGCIITNNGYFLKLKNFEKAARPSEFSKDGIISGLTDLSFSGVPIRWAAPESLLEGHYSIYSDVWSVNILADEILNYAAWPYSDISDADINDMIINIVFTHLKPQGFNRPRRVQGLILGGLADVPEQRLKLEALLERLREILDTFEGKGSCDIYDTYSGVDGASTAKYEIPALTERQIQAKSIFERGIPPSIQKFRESDEDPYTMFALEIFGNNNKLKKQSGIDVKEITSVDNYKTEFKEETNQIYVTERVTDEFVRHTYDRLKEIDSREMCVKPWPPRKTSSADGIINLNYKFPRSTHLLDIALHKSRGDTIGPYIELLFELANHVDSFHSAGWIFRCLRAKNVWILKTKNEQVVIEMLKSDIGQTKTNAKPKALITSTEKTQTIVVPKFGKYRMIVSSEYDTHLEQIKVETHEDLEGVQWLPIEAIKAGLYSKESDVYAFGMITWEVMSAFGQEDNVYDLDDDLELMCIPFNYQQSEKILPHLIKGYIPEKPLKCPTWFYQEVTRPCLLHQKIDRPSIKTILQILQTKLCKTLPKQILSRQSSKEDMLKNKDEDNYEVYEVYEDIDLSDEDVSNITENTVSLPKLPQIFVEESETTNIVNTQISAIRRLPPSIPGSYNTDDNNEEDVQPSPPPLQSLSQKLSNSKKTSEQECSNDCNDAPPIPRRVSLTGISRTQEELQIPDMQTCKSLPLPNIVNIQISAIRRLPPSIPGSYNTDDNNEEDVQPSPPPLQSLSQKLSNSKKTSEQQECSNDCNDAPPIPRRVSLTGISRTQEELQIPDMHTCKSLPLPNIVNTQIPVIRRLPPSIPGSYNTDDNNEEDVQPSPPPLQSLPQILSNSKKTSEQQECSNDCNDAPPIPRRVSLTGISRTQEELQIPDMHTCKSLPLPNIP